MRPRDVQRSRVYATGWKAGPSDGWRKFVRHDPYRTTIPEIQAYVDWVLSRRGVQSRWGQQEINVRPGKGHRRATASWWGIQIPLWARTEDTVLHEVAHVLNRAHDGAHGPGYAGTLVTLVRIIVGPEAGRELRASMRRNRVRVSMKSVPKAAASRVVTKAKVAAKKRAADEAPVSHESLLRSVSSVRPDVSPGSTQARSR